MENFLPKFEISDDLSANLRNIEIAKALSTGWYKGQFDYYLRKLGKVRMINGEEYYLPLGNMKPYRNQFFTKGTTGYYMAEFLRLIGLQDEDLNELRSTAKKSKVTGVHHLWKAKEGITPSQFKKNVRNLDKGLSGIDSIEIDYENQRYKLSDFPLEINRIYNTKESIYGDSLKWGQLQGSYGVDQWTDTNKITNLNGIQEKTVMFAFGKQIRFKRLGVDVTSEYPDELKYAVQSMIMYSGNEFMQRVSYSKKEEIHYVVNKFSTTESEEYVSVVGTEIFSGTIKQAFIDDEDNKHFIRYTGYSKQNEISKLGNIQQIFEEKKTVLTDRKALIRTVVLDNTVSLYYASNFWSYSNLVNHTDEIFEIELISNVNNGEEFLFYNTKKANGGVYIKVKEFRKLSMEDMGYYIQEYFDIRVAVEDGGFFSGFIGALAGFLGKLFDFAFEIFNAVPVLKLSLQILTLTVNKLFGSDFSEEEIFKIGVQVLITVVGIVFAPLTMGQSLVLSTAVSLAIAGSDAEDAKKEAEKKAEQEKKLKEKRAEERKKEQEEEQMRQTINGESQESEREEFMMFLKNPLYKLDREKKQLESDFKSQFKLL